MQEVIFKVTGMEDLQQCSDQTIGKLCETLAEKASAPPCLHALFCLAAP